MSSLTKEQVVELTERINERLAEFGEDIFEIAAPGNVRLAYDVIEEWQTEQGVPAGTAQLTVRDEPAVSGYVAGYAQGWRDSFAEMMRQADEDDDSSGGDDDDTEPGPDFDGGFYMKTPAAHTVHVNGDPEMSEETAWAIGQVADAAFAQLTPPPPPKNVEKLTSPPELPLESKAAQSAPVSEATAGMLLPEHPIGPPLVPRRGLPDPDLARANLATALAGSGMESLARHKPRTLAEVDAEIRPTKHRMSRPEKRAANLNARAPSRKGADPTLNEVIVQLQRMAMGGKMPSMKTWDESKPATWPVATTLLSRLDLTWTELAKEAELTPTLR